MIERHETWDIVDASKLQTYMRCPRKFWWRYVKGWRPEGISKHLVFGSAWHEAMRCLLLRGYSPEAQEEAYQRFLVEYRKEFNEATDMDDKKKNPGAVRNALKTYCEKYKGDDEEVIHTEVSGSVPVLGAVMHFKLDAVLKDEDGYLIREHKTGSRLDKRWLNQWALKMQVLLYMHAACCYYGIENLRCVQINGTIFRSKDQEHVRVDVKRNIPMLEAWLQETRQWLDRLDRDWALHDQEMFDGCHVMQSFPRNGEACYDFGGCPYHDFCAAWANPMERAGESQPGMVTEWWDPRIPDSPEAVKWDLSKGKEKDNG